MTDIELSNRTRTDGPDDPLVQVRDLQKYYDEGVSFIDRLVGDTSPPVKAVDDVSLEIYPGETLGIVGESGCGKSTLGETLLRLREATAGDIVFDGQRVFELEEDEQTAFRRRAQIVFQDPYSSLNPRMTIGAILREPFEIHEWPATKAEVTAEPVVEVDSDIIDVEVDVDLPFDAADHESSATEPDSLAVKIPVTVQTAGEDIDVETPPGVGATVTAERERVRLTLSPEKEALRRLRTRDLLDRVGLSQEHVERYPNEFSGGQRQRIGIARAIALEPDFIVLDEPVSALDVSVQAQILNLLEELQDDLGLTYLFIAHDLSVVRHISDRVAIMYLGKVAEVGPIDDIFEDPKHPYTNALLESVPRAKLEEQDRRIDALAGDVPSPRDPPSGCRFRTRCPALIPPEGYELPQETWRAIADLRDLVLDEKFDEDSFDHLADNGQLSEHAIRDSFGIPDEIDDPNAERAISRVITAIADDEIESARERLEAEFETPCETVVPDKYDVGDERNVACLLYEQSE